MDEELVITPLNDRLAILRIDGEKLRAQYPILKYFEYDHLQDPLKKFSSEMCMQAYFLAADLPRNAETSTALRKLLEAKDAAVRSALEIEHDG